MSKRFKLILTVRFLGYVVFFLGLTSLIFMIWPVATAEFGYRKDRILGIKRTVPEMIISPEQPAPPTEQGEPAPSSAQIQSESGGPARNALSNAMAGGPVNFSSVDISENSIIPVSTEYGIVIEKINANARIIPNVSPGNEREYLNALRQGVAEAAGSTLPGQPGNLYLFSHSTDAPWNIVRFNAVFYLLKELESGDRVIIFYKNRRYDYVVFDKIIASPSDVSYLTNRYDSPILTLQTCDPPGTLLNRLIVRAKLVSS